MIGGPPALGPVPAFGLPPPVGLPGAGLSLVLGGVGPSVGTTGVSDWEGSG